MDESIEELFEMRAGWCEVVPVPGIAGEGYDVVLRIDGTYFDESLAGTIAAEWVARLRAAGVNAHLGIRKDEL